MTTQNGGFGKHFSKMYEGSMIGSGAVVFAVMGYVIANQAPGRGEPEKLFVELNPKLLGFVLGEAEEAVERAIAFLCEPDPRSRSKEQEGRRLVRVGQFEFWVVNGRMYRDMTSVDRRKEQNREAQRRFRAKKTGRQVRAESESRERRYAAAVERGDQAEADAIAAENLPGTNGV